VAKDYLLNATLEVLPAPGGKFLLRAPLWGQTIDADRYQVGLLHHFESPSSVERALAEYPFRKAASREFLDACVARGFLLALGAGGQPTLPDRANPLTTVFGTPAFDSDSPAAFTFVGVPFDANTTGMAGAKMGPAAIRVASEGARYKLDPHTLDPVGFHDYASGTKWLDGISLADAGDVFIAPGEDPQKIYDRITKVVRELIDCGTIPLVLGGDHSITYPILRAFPSERLGVIHLDAHTDLGEPMPGAGLHHGNVFTVVLERLEYVERVVQFGLRGVLDATEHAENELVTMVGIDELRADGVQSAIDQIEDGISYYVSIDIDVLDPVFAPSTGTPVANGLHPHELKAFLHEVAQQKNIIGADIVEVAGASSPADPTAPLALECMLSLADGIVKGVQQRLANADTGSHGHGTE